MQPLPPLRLVDVSVLGGLPGQRGAAGVRLVGRGPVWVGSVAGVGPLPLLALPVRPVYLPPLPLSPRVQRRELVRCLLPTPDDMVQVVVALRVPAQRPAVPAPVIGLSHLNEFVRQSPFKMETVASVLLSVRGGIS